MGCVVVERGKVVPLRAAFLFAIFLFVLVCLFEISGGMKQ